MIEVDWQTVVALLALAFSVFAFRKTHNLAEKQTAMMEEQRRLNALLVTKEEGEFKSTKEANLSANVVRIGKTTRVKIFNRGKANARNVLLSYDRSVEHFLVNGDVDAKFPLAQLEPQQGLRYWLQLTLGERAKWISRSHGTMRAALVV